MLVFLHQQMSKWQTYFYANTFLVRVIMFLFAKWNCRAKIRWFVCKLHQSSDFGAWLPLNLVIFYSMKRSSHWITRNSNLNLNLNNFRRCSFYLIFPYILLFCFSFLFISFFLKYSFQEKCALNLKINR